MPLSPNIAAQYADGVAEAYRDAELEVLRAITQSLAQGIDTPDWQLRTLARAQAVRQQVIGILARVDPIAASRILADITSAYGAGQASVLIDIRSHFPALSIAPTLQGQAAVVGLVADARDAIGSTQPTILRAVDDVYREVTRRATAATLTGGSQKTAVQRALNTLLGKGLNGITTQSGRKMGLGDYVTMAVRTAVARSAFAGADESMGQAGLTLARILPGPRACDICDRWARKVLARTGMAGQRQVRDVVTGRTITVTADDTLAAAKRAGWGHPNCRCSLEPFIPGVTRKGELIQRPKWDEDGYQAQQQQRSIERQVRAWKTREAIAIDPADAAAARRQVKAAQARMRDHLAEHPSLKRQSGREQITGTLTGNSKYARVVA